MLRWRLNLPVGPQTKENDTSVSLKLADSLRCRHLDKMLAKQQIHEISTAETSDRLENRVLL